VNGNTEIILISGFSVKRKLKTSLMIKDGRNSWKTFQSNAQKRFLENSY
jgi:hypothetical protein